MASFEQWWARRPIALAEWDAVFRRASEAGWGAAIREGEVAPEVENALRLHADGCEDCARILAAREAPDDAP